MLIRSAAPDELAAVGDLTVAAYAADGYLDHADDYADELRDAARRAELATLLVAVDEQSGAVLGTATFVLAGTPYAEVSHPGEAEFRMLAVAKEARGQGVGCGAGAVLHRAGPGRREHALALCSLEAMVPAQRIYQRMGFVRSPDRDWEPLPGLTLVAFVLPLQPAL